MRLIIKDKKTNQVIEKDIIDFRFSSVWETIECVLKEEMDRDIVYYHVEQWEDWCEFSKDTTFDIEIRIVNNN